MRLYVLLLIFMTLLPLPGTARNILMCKQVYWGLYDHSTNTIQRGQNVVEQYKRLLSLEQIADKLESLDHARTRYHELSANEQSALIELIQNNYSLMLNLKYHENTNFKSLKRHFDLHISEIFNAKNFFHRKIQQEGKSLKAALNEYYRELGQITGLPQTVTHDTVMMTALRLQEGLLQAQHNIPQNALIVLYGSFPNGRSVPKKSDLDYAVTSERLHIALGEKSLAERLPEYDFTSAQSHHVRHHDIHSLAYVSPLVIIITRDYISLRVYEEASSRQLHNRKVEVDEYFF